MKLSEIKDHWDNLSAQYNEDLKSTTKTTTIKKLEINAIANSIKELQNSNSPVSGILEVGCGNGHNIFGLSKIFPNSNFIGVDYSNGMIKNASEIKINRKCDNAEFIVGDILKLHENSNLKEQYDIVFTDRCIINMNTIELQLNALENLSDKVKEGGHLIIMENSMKTYNNQNICRTALGLKPRTPDEYNLFIDEYEFLKFAKNKLRLLDVNDYASLHDIILYVLLPKINNGKIDYSHPIMDAVTELLINMDSSFKNSFGNFGQNRLYLFKK